MLLLREITGRELPLHRKPPSIGLSAMKNRVNGVNEECLPSVAHFYFEAAQRVVGDCLQTGMKSSKQVVGNSSDEAAAGGHLRCSKFARDSVF